MPNRDRADGDADSRRALTISVLVPVLNEEKHIAETVAAMQAQEFAGTVELLFADGGSEDRTREILGELAGSDSRIRLLDNPRRSATSGLNVCLRAARGEYVARMDAHTYYGSRYLADGVDRLRAGGTEWVSGPAIPRPTGPVSGAIALALASRLGRGGSRKWEQSEGSGERELDTGVFGGVWRRKTLLDVGGWDERWPINQDSEMAARFLTRGARLVCLASMTGYYVPRNSFPSLARQYFRYGFYRARTFQRHPHSMRKSHLIAPSLVVLLVAALLPSSCGRIARRLLCGYGCALAASGVAALLRTRKPEESALLVAVLPTMHLSWGAGALAGTARFGLRAALARVARRVAGPQAEVEEPFAPSLGDVGA